MRRTTILLAALTACTGTDVGNPITDLDFALYSEEFPPEDATAGGLVSIDEAWVAVDRIRLRSAADCNGGAAIELEGIFAVDLLAPGPIDELAMLELPAGDYCRFELRWAPSDAPGAGPAELAGASLLLAGTAADGTPFVLRSDRGDELRLDAIDGAFTIDEATLGLFVGLSGSRLFAGVDLASAELTGGIARIEDGSNDALLDRFEANVDEATDLFGDADGDGELDEPEREVPLAD